MQLVQRRSSSMIHRGGVAAAGCGNFLSQIQRISIAFLAFTATGFLSAQSIPSEQDCSDPLLSATTCSQSMDQAPSATGLQNIPAPNLQDLYPGNRNSNYSDTEQLNGYPPYGTSQSGYPQSIYPQNGQGLRRNPAPQQTEPLTEFQNFVASTTGQILPIYGANLFRNAPSTFAPVDLAPVPADYVVGPGDELRIRIWGQVNQQANLRVDRSGEIYLPQVGQTHVAGLTFSQLDGHLREAVGRVFKNFDLTVDVGQIRAIQVYLSGAARRPGVYTVSSLSTLADALFASGGPSISGALRAIELRRGGEAVTRFDLYDLLIRGDKTKDAKLISGDVIYIPPAGSQVAIVGSVHTPAIYELLPSENLSQLIAEAGGTSTVAAESRISIERIDDHRDRQAMEVAFNAAGTAIPLADGDLIRVYSIVPKYDKTVILRGNVANPGRFGWHPGMHISDLIPDKESLLTRDYWWRRGQMGLPAPQFEPVPGFSNRRQPVDGQPVTLPRPGQPRSSSDLDQQNPYQNPYQNQYQNQYPGPNNQQYGADGQTIPSNSGADQSDITGRMQVPAADQRASNSTLAIQQNADSSQYQAQGSAARNDVRLSAPEIDWDYAVIERLDPETLKTKLIPFDLGKLVLQHDASQDLEMQPSDVVTIFSQADISVPVAQQTKLVRLEGEFVHAGVYSVQPGETLQQLVERAGGLTPNAYLFGSEFTRQSTRVVQQARIDEYVQSLALNIQRGAVQLAGSSTASAQTLASASAAQTSEQNLLAALRRVRATGRIVLVLKPVSSGSDALPAMALEDGDRFVVPHTPSAINVVGSVYNQNSFLYAEQTRVGTYLRLAGGPNKDADRRHEFVIRADGEVVTRDASKGPWGNEFSALRMNPGDTIVVPEKTFKPSALYGIMNWSQMFSQLALGAASLSVIQ